MGVLRFECDCGRMYVAGELEISQGDRRFRWGFRRYITYILPELVCDDFRLVHEGNYTLLSSCII